MTESPSGGRLLRCLYSSTPARHSAPPAYTLVALDKKRMKRCIFPRIGRIYPMKADHTSLESGFHGKDPNFSSEEPLLPNRPEQTSPTKHGASRGIPSDFMKLFSPSRRQSRLWPPAQDPVVFSPGALAGAKLKAGQRGCAGRDIMRGPAPLLAAVVRGAAPSKITPQLVAKECLRSSFGAIWQAGRAAPIFIQADVRRGRGGSLRALRGRQPRLFAWQKSRAWGPSQQAEEAAAVGVRRSGGAAAVPDRGPEATLC